MSVSESKIAKMYANKKIEFHIILLVDPTVVALVYSIVFYVLQDDLVTTVVQPYLCHVDMDEDVSVRKCSVEILLHLCPNCSPQNFIDLINIIEKVRYLKHLHWVKQILNQTDLDICVFYMSFG